MMTTLTRQRTKAPITSFGNVTITRRAASPAYARGQLIAWFGTRDRCESCHTDWPIEDLVEIDFDARVAPSPTESVLLKIRTKVCPKCCRIRIVLRPPRKKPTRRLRRKK